MGSPGADSTGSGGGDGTDTIDVSGLGDGGDSGAMGPSCAAATFSATLRPLDLYILLDQSGSMKENEDRWTPVSQAISNFISGDDASGINVAIQYFALGDTDALKCDVASYAQPEVEPTDLSTGAALIDASLAAHDFPQAECCTNDNEHNGTPTRPAVEGALQFLRSWTNERPDHAAALLLATDGAPTADCSDNGVDDVARVIEESAQAENAIPTYVIGIGEEDSLAAMAEAGGTGMGAFLVDGSGADTQSDFAAALKAIRGQAIPCDYDFPEGDSTDPNRLNVTYTPNGSGESVTAILVEDAASCDSAVDEWYYKLEGGERRIHLCPRLCSTVNESTQGAVDLIVGCATRIR